MKIRVAMSILIVTFCASLAASPVNRPVPWPLETLVGVEILESAEGRLPPAADILSCYIRDNRIRIRLPLMVNYVTGVNEFEKLDVEVEVALRVGAQADFNADVVRIKIGPTGLTEMHPPDTDPLEIHDFLYCPECGIIEFSVRPGSETFGFAARPPVEIRTFIGGESADYAYFDPEILPTYTTNCAFMHHGNQSLSYTDVFRGRSADIDGSGFDETLEAHQTYSIPGNFHLSGPIQTGAEWYDAAFNDWLADGVTAGWVEMITSAYGQHIMPFVADEMNNWSVYIEGQMVNTRYGFTPRVAWVPERTFLDGPGGGYPNDGVNDWIADDFTDNGVWAVILDDNVHLSGYDNHQIHTLSGSGLKLIARDNDFTGKLHAGDGAGALNNLIGMANDPSGPYRIAVYADDWEMAAEMGEWATSMPNAKETYDWIIQQCNLESSWLSTWKLTDAVSNPNFAGVTASITWGAHPSIGGADGYGGGNNGWYTDWAGYASPSDQHFPAWNFGYIWSDAKNNLVTCPDNNTAQAGWYVLMSNLYETGWHDGMGGPISGWEMKHSTHIKNANVYAEAARWANGDLTPACAAIYDDWDHDGDNELVIYNDRICAVFEHTGGRAHWIFGKGGATSWEGSIAGNCNAYWEGTEGDYNDANHIAPLSDVGVGGSDYEHSLYSSNIDISSTDSTVITLGCYLLEKRITVKPGEPYLRVYYDTGPDVAYIKTGFTPDLVDVVWNCEINRLWNTTTGVYCGWHNPNSGVAGGIILGTGGASHSTDFQSTILKGDEIKGSGGFGFLLYAGEVSGVAGMIVPAWNTLSASVTDIYPPRAYYSSYHPGTDVMEIAFGDTVQFDVVTMTKIGVDSDGDGTSDVNLDGACTVINVSDSKNIRIQLSSAKATAVEALSMTDPYLWLDDGAFIDLRANGNIDQTATVGRAVQLNVLPNTSITIDGLIDTAEWLPATRIIDDPDDDSEWGLDNEIYDLYMFWDATYLYFGIHGVKETSRYVNSWLLYLDSDWGGLNGQSDLTAIDNWDRNAQFTGGFLADIQYGSWGAGDGDVWDILTATTSVQITDGVIVNTDLTADRPGSEIAISWDAIYGLGEGFVPAGAEIAVCASFAGQNDDDDLGGDCCPDQISSLFPVLDNFHNQLIDGNGDGLPDDFFDIIGVEELSPTRPEDIAISAYPNPFNSAVTISVGASHASPANVEIFDINGRIIYETPVGAGSKPACMSGGSRTLPYEVIWSPDNSLGSGIYLVRIKGTNAATKVVYLK
ncbi:hypothetical protein DRQ36_06205 [bacterium]|nr:MAG: hypothetical protein DRQ36_06205 [bacterium]